jgi:hypothetical protein
VRDRDAGRGERLLASGRHAKAAAAFRAALRRSPDNPSVWLRVADAEFLAGRPAAAARAARRAHELGGGPDLLRRRAQAALLAGDEASVRRALARAAPAERGEAAFWRAVLACRAGRWAEARRLFLAAVTADPERLAERAGLLAAWAGHRAAGAPRPPRGRGVVIAGLGWRRPRQATVGALDALSACRSILAVANTVDDATRDVLCLFRARVRAAVFRGTEAEASRAASRALAAGTRARSGTVTRGHPLAYGRFAARVVAGARARGLPLEVFPGVSAFEGLAAEARPAPGAPLGLELRGAFSAADRDPSRAAMVFTPTARAGALALARALPRSSGRLLWLASEGPSAAVPQSPSPEGLRAALRAGAPPGILYLPPRRPSR